MTNKIALLLLICLIGNFQTTITNLEIDQCPSTVQDKNDVLQEFSKAIENDDVAAVRRLLESGSVDANQLIPSGNTAVQITPLYEALLHRKPNHIKIVCLLLEHGATIIHCPRADLSPLSFAISMSNVEAVKLFLAFNVDVNAIEPKGVSPLWIAIFLAIQAEKSSLMPEETLKFNLKDCHDSDMSPEKLKNLIENSLQDAKTIISLLIKHGADLHKHAFGCQSAYDLLVNNENSPIARFVWAKHFKWDTSYQKRILRNQNMKAQLGATAILGLGCLLGLEAIVHYTGTSRKIVYGAMMLGNMVGAMPYMLYRTWSDKLHSTL